VEGWVHISYLTITATHPNSCLLPPAPAPCFCRCSCCLPASCSCLLLLPLLLLPAPASCSCVLLLPPASASLFFELLLRVISWTVSLLLVSGALRSLRNVWISHYSKLTARCPQKSVSSHSQESRGFRLMKLLDRSSPGGADNRCPLPYGPHQPYPGRA
jgi:hypothetical protein